MENKTTMERLTRREEELMHRFWEHGPMFVRELVALFPDPKPHFNTISTMVRSKPKATSPTRTTATPTATMPP